MQADVRDADSAADHSGVLHFAGALRKRKASEEKGRLLGNRPFPIRFLFRSQHFGFINSVLINLFPTFYFSFFVIF